jgi:hypothetical protein
MLGTAGALELGPDTTPLVGAWNTFIGFYLNTTYINLSVVPAPNALVTQGTVFTTYTNSSAVAGTSASKLWATCAGAVIDAGKIVARNPSDGTILLCNALATAGNYASNVFGVSLNRAEVGQPVHVAISDAGATPAYTGNGWTAGSLIFCSGAGVPSEIVLEDAAMGFVGFVKSDGKWLVSPVNSGVAYAP